MADGKIVAYVGAMGAGKSKKLVEIYRKLSEKGKHIIVFKHANDGERGGQEDAVVARNGDTAPAHAIHSLAEILMYETERVFDAVLIDEIQFFDDDYTVEMLEAMAMVGVDVYVFGLDITSDFNNFGLMGEILTRADEVKKLKCRCHLCGAPARVSKYVGAEPKGGAVKVGDIGEYQPTCRPCFYADKNNITKEQVKEPPKAEPPKEDKYYEFTLRTATFALELGVYESDLLKAGYTYDDVKDINSMVGAENLLKDLGYM